MCNTLGASGVAPKLLGAISGASGASGASLGASGALGATASIMVRINNKLGYLCGFAALGVLGSHF